LIRRAEHTSVLRLAWALAGAGVAASAAAIATALGSIHRVSATSGQLKLAGVAFSYPRLNGAAWVLLGLAVIGASAITIAVRASLRQRRAYGRFLEELEVVGDLAGHPSVQVIADPRPQAFCAGYLRPRVYLSQAALDMLSDSELDAVLAHEQHHRLVRDPLRFACGRVLGAALFFLPALRAMFARYADVAELNADGAAIRVGAGGRAALASALLAFEASGAGVPPERVDALLGQSARWNRPWWLMSASLGSLSSLSGLIWAASQAASTRATLSLPFLSAQPCLAILTLLLVVFAVVIRRRAVLHRA
jgi:Zn-dependent protease with chaperone function